MHDDDLDLVVKAAQSAIATAVRRSNSNVITRPATVTGISSDSTLAEVVLDGDDSMTPIGAQVIYSTGVIIGDRVLIMFVEPHGTFLIGRRGGDFDRWHYVGSVANPDDPDFVAGWGHLAGAGWSNTATTAFCSFRRHGRIVELRGGATRSSGVSTRIFRLPSEYTPENTLTMPAIGSLGAHTVVTVSIDGLVATTDTTVIFDGITFSVNRFGDEADT